MALVWNSRNIGIVCHHFILPSNCLKMLQILCDLRLKNLFNMCIVHIFVANMWLLSSGVSFGNEVGLKNCKNKDI